MRRITANSGSAARPLLPEKTRRSLAAPLRGARAAGRQLGSRPPEPDANAARRRRPDRRGPGLGPAGGGPRQGPLAAPPRDPAAVTRGGAGRPGRGARWRPPHRDVRDVTGRVGGAPTVIAAEAAGRASRRAARPPRAGGATAAPPRSARARGRAEPGPLRKGGGGGRRPGRSRARPCPAQQGSLQEPDFLPPGRRALPALRALGGTVASMALYSGLTNELDLQRWRNPAYCQHFIKISLWGNGYIHLLFFTSRLSPCLAKSHRKPAQQTFRRHPLKTGLHTQTHTSVLFTWFSPSVAHVNTSKLKDH